LLKKGLTHEIIPYIIFIIFIVFFSIFIPKIRFIAATPFVYVPQTFNESSVSITTFQVGNKVITRANVSDNLNATRTANITINDTAGTLKVNSQWMTNMSISCGTNCTIFEYNYTLTATDPIGTWVINVSANDTDQNWASNGTTFTVQVGNLTVNLTNPDPGVYTDSNPRIVTQNTTFNVNATVTCRNANCGNVTGYLRYNASSSNPDTLISNITGVTPFYTNNITYAMSEFLYVDSFDSSFTEWNMTGASPYLNATDYFTNHINTTSNGKRVGNWTFENTSFYGTINKVEVQFYAKSGSGGSGSGFTVWIWNGSWNDLGEVGISSSFVWRIVDLTSTLNARDKINNATLYIVSWFGALEPIIDTARLNVTYKSPCENMNQGDTCQLNWTVNATGTLNSVYKIGVKFNSSYTSVINNHTNNATVKITEGAGKLIVSLINPTAGATTIQDQNTTFNVNASVTCVNDACGTVYGTVQYNGSSANPDTPVNSSQGNIPFYNTSGTVLQSCGSMSQNQVCQLNWTINATGDFIKGWKIGVLFNSSSSSVTKNHTNNATIKIVECHDAAVTIRWGNLDFSDLVPNTNNNSAPGNNNKTYNISNLGTCTLNVWIKGTNLTNTTPRDPADIIHTISVGNLTWSNTTNVSTSAYIMNESYVILNSSYSPTIKNITTYYWLSVPPIPAGGYNGTITYCANTSQQSGESGSC